jgi:hypothetical protein
MMKPQFGKVGLAPAPRDTQGFAHRSDTSPASSSPMWGRNCFYLGKQTVYSHHFLTVATLTEEPMPDDETIVRLLGTLYAAPMQPELWRAFLQQLCGFLLKPISIPG